MTIHKLIIIPTLVAVALSGQCKADNPPLLLTDETIAFVDGIHGILDGEKIGQLIKLRLFMLQIRFGKKNADNSHTGLYTFRGESYCLQELRDLEITGNNSLKSDLAAILKIIKDDFQKKIRPLMDDARGNKKKMVKLITEWAQKAKRLDSYLLDWAKTPEGQEPEAFQRNITTLEQLDTFMDDLIYYFETMIRSCPKAYKQFRLIIEQKQKDKINGIRHADDE